MNSTSHRLLLPTDRTVAGPKYSGDGQHLVVEYDHEEDDGSIAWSAVAFDDVLKFSYRQGACCAAADILGAHELGCTQDSALLREVVTRWQESVGWQEWQQKQGGATRFKHYKLYFDDIGCVDVVAGNHNVKPVTSVATGLSAREGALVRE